MKKRTIITLLAGLSFIGVGLGLTTIKADANSPSLVNKGVQAINQESQSSSVKKLTKQQKEQQSMEKEISQQNASVQQKQAKQMDELTKQANESSSKHGAFYRFAGRHKILTIIGLFVIAAVLIGGVAMLGGIF